MVFSSLLFLFLFLPVVLFLYYLAPRRFRNAILFGVSLFFYAWGEPIYIVLMLFSTFTDFGLGRLLGRKDLSQHFRRWVVTASIFINLSLLSFFKYADFAIDTVNQMFQLELPLVDLPLPIGISFYTFQSLSYIIDVYRREVEPERNWIDFGAYVSLFPQLVAGPIVQYHTVADQLANRVESRALFVEGVRRFIMGLGKKVLLANNIGQLWHTISTGPLDTLPTLTAWLGILAFALQIYFDFSGYSDMAIGLGLMFGFRFNENFNLPYRATSITDFWRRWHISLGSWFRNYVYIPLGGNRRGLLLQLRNILIVWLLTGFWHGANWNFILWGLYFGILLIAEKWFVLRLLSFIPRAIQHMYALFFIAIGWVIFVFEDLKQVQTYLGRLFDWTRNGIYDETTLYYLTTNGVLLLIGMVISIVPRKTSSALSWSQVIGLLLLLVLSVAYLVDASFNPFLYFRF